jgi:hypothetical protein
VENERELVTTENLIEDLRGGSLPALIKTTRMITEVLVEFRAYDFEDRWEVFIEGVLGQLLSGPPVLATQIPALVRRTSVDELAFFLRAAMHWTSDGELPWCETTHMAEPHTDDVDAIVAEFAQQVEKLPEQRSLVVADVFGDGRSFDQVAAHRKIPLRMVKRFLRESIWDLRERCSLHKPQGASGGDERVKSCLKSLELDLPAFLVEPQLEEWRDFRRHYPVCQDCSLVVANWSKVEAMVRAACGGPDRHPSSEDLIALHRDGEGLAYAQYVSLMRHLDGCPPCSEAMTLLSRLDRRPIAEVLMSRAAKGKRSVRPSRIAILLGRLRTTVRGWLGR